MMTSDAFAYAPLTSVVVATDFSPTADHALARALQLPLAPGAKVELLHVVPAELSDQTRQREEVRAALDRLAATTRAAGRELRVEPRIERGQTHVEIIRASRRASADLVVIGRHGRRTIKDRLLGTTAARVVRKGDVPVLVVGREPAGPYRSPLIATDLQDAANWVFEVCLRVLGPEVRAIDVVHAYHVPFEGLVSPASPELSSYRTSFQTDAAARLDAMLSGFAATGVTWRPILRLGDPRMVVLDAALVCASDLLALGTHGRTGLAHALLGSVAETLVDASPCDVLISRPVRFAFEAP